MGVGESGALVVPFRINRNSLSAKKVKKMITARILEKKIDSRRGEGLEPLWHLL